MTIEIMSLITILSVGFGIFGVINTWKRNRSIDDKNESTLLATMNVKQDNMNESLREIKFDVKSIKEDNQTLREKVIEIEQSVKSAHKRIDAIEVLEKHDKSISE